MSEIHTFAQLADDQRQRDERILRECARRRCDIWREALLALREELESRHGYHECDCDFEAPCVWCAPERVMQYRWRVGL